MFLWIVPLEWAARANFWAAGKLTRQTAFIFFDMKHFGLLITLISINSIAAVAHLDQGNLYDNYSDFEACQAFLDGDNNIAAEMWTTDFNTCEERWPDKK